MENALYVGVARESIAEASKAILEIFKTGADQDTKRIALEVLRDICRVDHTDINDCTINEIHNAVAAETDAGDTE